MKRILCPIVIFLQGILGICRGISFIDSTVLTVRHARRISSYKLFRKMAEQGKTSTGWFYGLKLHLSINDQREIFAFMLTAGNIDDKKPVPIMIKDFWGKCFGDKGYLSSTLFEELWEKGVQLITKYGKGCTTNSCLLWIESFFGREGS